MFQLPPTKMVIYILKNGDVPVPKAEKKNHDRVVASRVALCHELGAVETGGLVLGTKWVCLKMLCTPKPNG